MSEARPVLVNHPELQAESPAPASEPTILKKFASSVKSLVPSGISRRISTVSLGNRSNKSLASLPSTLSNKSSFIITKSEAPPSPTEDAQPSLAIHPNPNLDSSDTALSEGVLAFRSITTFTAAFRKVPVMRFTDPDSRSLIPEVRRELMMVTALASTLVRDFEVTAVVPVTGTVKGGQLLQVIVLTHFVSNDADHSQWNVWSTQNHRHSAPAATGEGNLKERMVNGKIDHSFLQKSNSKTQTFADHVAVISGMINNLVRCQADGIPDFREYVVASCAPRMLLRMKNKLSQPFIQSLMEVDVSAIKFVSSYRKDILQADVALCHTIPFLNKLWPGTIPRLVERCDATTADKSYQLYTADTYKEFHQVLCRLLGAFKLALENLQNSRATPTPDPTPEDPTPESPFTQALDVLVLFGRALHSLARSGAIECHLQVIASQLSGKKHSGETTQEDVPHKDLQRVQPPALQDDKPELSGIGSGEEERDEDLQRVQPSALQDNDQSTPRSTTWKSFGDWLNLMTVNFDAVDILSRFVISGPFPYGGVSIKYMPPPPVTRELLPWETLLRSKHFPTGQNSDREEPSNEDIIKFLKTMSGEYKIINAANNSLTQLVEKKRTPVPKVPLISKKLVNHRGMADFDNIIKNMNHDLKEAVDKIDIDAAKLDIEAIASAAEGLKRTDVAGAVLEMKSILNALAPNSAFFSKLADSEKGEGFTGAEHCEALISILISLSRAGKPLPQSIQTLLASMKVDIEKAGLVIGVSKPCCPVCRVLLELLNALLHDNETFVTRGSHSMIYGCSLPVWLPEDIVHAMNMKFGGQLRQQLVQFMSDFKSMRNRTQSLSSRRLSKETLANLDYYPSDGFNDKAVDSYYRSQMKPKFEQLYR